MPTSPRTPSLVPAIRTTHGIITGEAGDSHDDVLSRQPDYPRNTFDRSLVRGFIDDRGKFLSRREAFAYARRHRLLNDTVIEGEDELESGHLV